MHILMLGGTGFVGRHIAQAALAAGHRLTFFNRGITDAALFAGHPLVRGDRTTHAQRLATLDVDVAIDTSGYTPDEVRASAQALQGRIERYVFMSSIDAYDMSVDAVDETSATKELPAGATTAERVPELYGAHKARCERELVALLGAQRVLVLRAGLMVGPHDDTDRFTYWPVRVARGGEVLAPHGAAMPVQIIDVRDVAGWLMRALAAGLHGTYNLAGDAGTLTLGDLLDTARAVSGSDARATFVADDFLVEHEVDPWIEMPLWVPEMPELRALRNVRNDAARAEGLTIRPLAETVRDTLDEVRSRPPSSALKAGPSVERETELLRLFHAHAVP